MITEGTSLSCCFSGDFIDMLVINMRDSHYCGCHFTIRSQSHVVKKTREKVYILQSEYQNFNS